MYSRFPLRYTKTAKNKFKSLDIVEYTYDNKDDMKLWKNLIAESIRDGSSTLENKSALPAPVNFNFILNSHYTYVPNLDIFFPHINNLWGIQVVVSEKLHEALSQYKVFGAQIWPASITAKKEKRSNYYLVLFVKNAIHFFLNRNSSKVIIESTGASLNMDASLTIAQQDQRLVNFNKTNGNPRYFNAILTFTEHIQQYDLFLIDVYNVGSRLYVSDRLKQVLHEFDELYPIERDISDEEYEAIRKSMQWPKIELHFE